MIYSPQALQRMRHCGSATRQNFGGSSKSEQKTSNTDARVVGGDDSQNVSISGNAGPVSVMTTDHQAVAGSLNLALKGVEGAQQIAREAQAGANDLMAGIFSENSKQAANLTQAVVDLKTSDTRTLVIAGMAVVGLVAAQMIGKRAA